MSLKQNEVLYQDCKEWVEEMGADQVLIDEDGTKYVMVENEDGYKRVDLPRNFQDLALTF